MIVVPFPVVSRWWNGASLANLSVSRTDRRGTWESSRTRFANQSDALATHLRYDESCSIMNAEGIVRRGRP